MMKNFEYQLKYPYGQALAPVTWKQECEDFLVKENLSLEFSGEGEFLWLYIKKRNLNTEALAKEVAKAARIPAAKVFWSGLKDKKSVANQWLCLHLGGKVDRDKWLKILEAKKPREWEILEAQVHHKKLKIGTHQSNSFEVKLFLEEDSLAKPDLTKSIESRLESIKKFGFPNYFGPQRFGKNNSNLQTADKLFEGKVQVKNKHHRGLALSAARSYLFNLQVDHRIRSGNFDQPLLGDVYQIAGTQSLFTDVDSDIKQRVQNLEVHPTALLMGYGKDLAAQDCLELELEIETKHSQWVRRLKDFKVGKERRSIRCVAQELEWSDLSMLTVEQAFIELKFTLPKGSFASELIASVFDLKE